MSKAKKDQTWAAKRELDRMVAAREEQKASVRARLAARDAEYAASPYAAKIAVEVRGNVRIERRGQCVPGCFVRGEGARL